jgi:histidinol-phosphatase (PHP family)
MEVRIIDYHIHTIYSHDCDVPIVDRVLEAVRKGFYEIGFSDHVSTTPQSTEYNKFDEKGFFRDFYTVKRKFSERIRLKSGIEFGYNKAYEDEAKKYISSLKLDYVIGSIHRINGIAISSSKGYKEYFTRYDKDEAYSLYYEELLGLVESGLFNIVGHFDVVKKYAINFFDDISSIRYYELIIPILYTMVKNDIALEINTAGLHQPCGETYPSMDIIEKYYELGGRLFTFGSDAHHKEELGRDYEVFVSILNRFGIKEIPTFTNQKYELVSIKK